MNFRVYNLEKQEVSQPYCLEEVLSSGLKLANSKDDLIIMLGTGELDVNNKEIFVGDFAVNECGEYGVVMRIDGGFWLGYFDEPAKQELSTFKKHDKTTTTLRLTGHIGSFINEQRQYNELIKKLKAE